ncbi:hypothetical protein GA0070614_4356 [Micromonospora coxensis]|uniref:Uncharacterized protein n=1 Tax=Micromonospora coxensis TaxID=356852 RepID=A0A1C5JCA7_9ACTN|nr:hypothetical protein GA0070614_4356 [Micromonospora coxensis]
MGLAVVAAVLWAVGMTVLQPLTEPVGPWSETLPGNNTYWARDLRFLAILAVAAGLVLAGGGRRDAAVPAVLLAGGWLAVDVAVDRADPYGAGATVALAVAGCLAVAATATLVRRPARAAPDRPVLAGTACVAAVLVLVATLIESPTDREPELDPAALATAGLLLALTVAGALAAAPASPSPGTRRPDGSPLPVTAERRRRYAVAAGIAVVGLVGLVLVRAVEPGHRLTPAAALGTVLLAGVTLLAWDWPDGRPTWWRHGLATLVAAVLPVGLMVAVAVVTGMLRLAAPLTALAGNSPINSADSDVLLSLSGLLAGLGTALLLARPATLGQAPTPPEPPLRASAERR